MLYHPDWNSPFDELHTDASKHGIGVMLAQWHAGVLHHVKFASHSFTPVEGRQPTTHQELLAVKYLLEHFHHTYLGVKSPLLQIMLIFSGSLLISPNNLNLLGGVFQWQNLILKLNIMLALPMLSEMYLIVPHLAIPQLLVMICTSLPNL